MEFQQFYARIKSALGVKFKPFKATVLHAHTDVIRDEESLKLAIEHWKVPALVEIDTRLGKIVDAVSIRDGWNALLLIVYTQGTESDADELAFTEAQYKAQRALLEKILVALTEIMVIQPALTAKAAPVVTLSEEEQGQFEKLRSEWGSAPANVWREARLSEKRIRLMEATKASVALETEARIKIPSIKNLPYYVLQIFFLLAAVYDAASPARTFSFEEEKISTDIAVFFDEESAKKLQLEIAQLAQNLQLARDQQDNYKIEIYMERLSECNRALAAANNGSKWPVGAYIYTLSAKDFNFRCRVENEEIVRSAIRRWRLHYSENLPTEAELTRTEEITISTKLPASVFSSLKATIRTKIEDVIQSVLNLRTVGQDVLIKAAASVNKLAETSKKVQNYFTLSDWPQWCQAILTTSKSLSAGFQKISTEVEKRLKQTQMSASDQKYWQGVAKLSESYQEKIKKITGKNSLADLPEVWKMVIAAAAAKPDSSDYLNNFIDGKWKPEEHFQPPEAKTVKQTWAQIAMAPAPKKKTESAFLPQSILSTWIEYSQGKVIPAWVAKLWVLIPNTTEQLVKLQLAFDSMNGIEKSSNIKKHIPNDGDMADFWKIVYSLNFFIEEEHMAYLRKILRDGELLRVSNSMRERGLLINSMEDLMKEVSKLPVRAQTNKSEKGKKGKKGKAAGNNQKPNSGKSGQANKAATQQTTRGRQRTRGKGPKRGGDKSRSRSRSQTPGGSKKVRIQSPSGKRGSSPKPGGSRSKSPKSRGTKISSSSGQGAKNNNATAPKPQTGKGSGRTVLIDGQSKTVAELNRLVADSVAKNSRFVVVGNNSFTPSFLGKLLANRSIQRIKSRFDAKGKLVAQKTNKA